MNTIFKSLIGAAALVGASLSTASAQDYTWSLSNFQFQAFASGSGGAYTTLTGDDVGTASGTITFHRNGVNSYSVTGFNVNTTTGSVYTGSSTFPAASYVFGQGTDAASSSDAYKTFLQLSDQTTGNTFRLAWALTTATTSLLWDAMETGTQGVLVQLLAGGINSNGSGVAATREVKNLGYQRSIGCGGVTQCEGAPAYLQLTSVVTAVPEPASMAVLGAGLLGLFAARRRRGN